MTEKITSLKPLTEMCLKVKNISSKIREMFKTITPVKGAKFPITDEFNLAFHERDSFDVYIINNTLFLPYMRKEKLEHLQEFFESIQLPYIVEYDVQRLLDIQDSIQNDYHISEELLEQRALEMGLLCHFSIKGSEKVVNNSICN